MGIGCGLAFGGLVTKWEWQWAEEFGMLFKKSSEVFKGQQETGLRMGGRTVQRSEQSLKGNQMGMFLFGLKCARGIGKVWVRRME